MAEIWFAIAHFLQDTFDVLLVSAGWILPVTIACVLGFGALYWMNAQAKYNRRAKERNEYI